MDIELEELDVLDLDRPKIIYAGFVRRCLSFITDVVFLVIFSVILTLIMGYSLVNLLIITSERFQQIFMNPLYWVQIILFTSLFYFPLMQASNSKATFGNLIFRIRVVHSTDKRISVKRGLKRQLISIVSLIGFIGYFFIFFTNKKQTMHDMFSGTYVINKQKNLW